MVVTSQLGLFGSGTSGPGRVGDLAERLAGKEVSLGDLVAASDAEIASRVMDDGGVDKGADDGTFPELNGELPLPNPSEEHFACMLAAGSAGGVAYRECYSKRCTAETAKQQATRKRKLPRIAARLRWLQARRVEEERREKEALDRPGDFTRKDMMLLCAKIARNPLTNPVDVVRASELHNKLAREIRDEQERKNLEELDPASTMEYFRRSAEQGVDPEEAARKRLEEAGGGKMQARPTEAAEGQRRAGNGQNLSGGAQDVVVDGKTGSPETGPEPHGHDISRKNAENEGRVA